MIPEGIKRVAVFCIIKSGDQYLLLKRAKSPNQGKFVPVGGKIDPYESPIQAVIRETMEETGITISRPKVLWCTHVETSPVNYNWVSFIYCSRNTWIPAPKCDEGGLYWIHAVELKDLDTPPTDWHIYQYVDEDRPFVFQCHFDENLVMKSMVDELSGE
jgi:8-oxo-dGTP diphosphatase